MAEYNLIPVTRIVGIVARPIAAILILTVNARARSHDPERGAVTIEAEWTAAPGAPDRGWLRSAVIATGIGTGRDRQDRVFEDVVQADGAITRRVGGTGLGLSIGRRLVDPKGGTIRVGSRLGRNSRFAIILPARCEASATAPVRPDPVPPARASPTGAAAPWVSAAGAGGGRAPNGRWVRRRRGPPPRPRPRRAAGRGG